MSDVISHARKHIPLREARRSRYPVREFRARCLFETRSHLLRCLLEEGRVDKTMQLVTT